MQLVEAELSAGWQPAVLQAHTFLCDSLFVPAQAQSPRQSIDLIMQ